MEPTRANEVIDNMPLLPKFFTFQRGEYDTRIRKGNEVVIADALRDLYSSKILPLEKHYDYEDIFSSPLDPAYFDSKPLVLLFGEYSTGKTSFIKYILGKDYPGMRIGPEPTTENFIVVEYGEDEGLIPGNAAVVDKNKQFGSLAKFGGPFLNRFQLATVKSEILDKVTFIDTPGILSGEKNRGYDLTAVLRWFIERCDRIILLFDINKLDISDELRGAIDMVKGFEDKIRIVLNKCDTVTSQQLMRVYGALMWSLGKVMITPEAARVYIGSFWDNPWQNEENRKLFEEEEADLIVDFCTLPRDGDLRKMNDLVRRAKSVRIHGYLMGELRSQMPWFGIGATRRKKMLIRDLNLLYDKISRDRQIPLSDFPNIRDMRCYLENYDFDQIKSRKQKLFDKLDEALTDDISRLMALLPERKEDPAIRERERQQVLTKVWMERGPGGARQPGRLRGVSTRTVSSEKLSDTSGVESSGGEHRYQKIKNNGARPTALVVTREDLSSGASTGSAGSAFKRQTAPSPHVETRTIVTRTESMTTPAGDKVVRTETTLETPKGTEIKTSEATVIDGKTVDVKENVQVRPADPYLASYTEHQAPKIEALYATIQKRPEDKAEVPPKIEEKSFNSTTRPDETGAHKPSPEPNLEGLQKVSEKTTETTEVKIEEKTMLIATTSHVANGNVKSAGEKPQASANEDLGMNIKEEDDVTDNNGVDEDGDVAELDVPGNHLEEKEEKILNVAPDSASAVAAPVPAADSDPATTTTKGGAADAKVEPSDVIVNELKESYDQSSVKNYEGLINSE